MFYLWLNGAYVQTNYWDREAQTFTTDSTRATLFETREAADAEAFYAQNTTDGEVIVSQKRS